MDDDNRNEEVEYSNSTELSAHIPHMIISGNLKEGGKEGYHACVPRFCTVHITRIEFFGAQNPSNFIIALSMNSSKKTIRSIPVELKLDEDKTINLDFRFSFHYLHNLKAPFDFLRIMIQDKSKKKHPERVLGYTTVNMNLVLQSAVQDEMLLMTPRTKKKEKIEKKDESKKNEKKDDSKKKETDKVSQTQQSIQSKDSDKDIITRARRDTETRADIDLASLNLNEKDKESKPFATVSIAIAVYPEEVDSYQDAMDWDEEFMESFMVEARNDISSDEDEFESNDEMLSEEEEFLANPGATLDTTNTSATVPPLSAIMRSRYRNNGNNNNSKTKGKSKLDLRKYLKIKRGAKTFDIETEEHTTDESSFLRNVDDISLGSSSASEEDDEMSPPESPPRFKRRSSPILIHSPIQVSDTPPSSPLVKQLVEPIPLNKDDVTTLILVDTQKRRGRKLEDLLKSIPGFKGKIISAKTGNEIANLLNSFATQQKQKKEDTEMEEESDEPIFPSRIVIAGGDTFVNHILRPFVEILSKKPRDYQSTRFYVIPIGKKNDIAMHIASIDPTYRSLFFSPEWRDDLLDKSDELTEEEVKSIQKRVMRYIEEATSNFMFPIGEALLSFHSGVPNSPAVQKNIPFIKGLQIGAKDGDEKETDTADLQLDYWYHHTKKNRESHKDLKSFQFVAITRLPAVANALHIDSEFRPTPTTFSLVVQVKDKSRVEKMKEALQHFGSKSKKKEEEGIYATSAKINRMTCSSSGDNVAFRVLIDGVEYTNVTFVSVSPQWHSHIKSFPVQVFSARGSGSTIPSIPTSNPVSITPSSSLTFTSGTPSTSGQPSS